MRWRALTCLLLALPLMAADCLPPPSDAGPDGGSEFDDKTEALLASLDDFYALASVGVGSDAVKYVLTQFDDPVQRRIRYLDGTFYTLHDEWFWFRLMNGARVPGTIDVPYAGNFPTVATIYAWARDRDPDTLPLDLTWVGERLYSPRFYQLSLQTDPPQLGLGTVVHFPARTEPEVRDEIWAFELEFQDESSHERLSSHFTHLDASLPPGVSGSIKWLVRSPAQEELAVRMETDGLTYADRILRFSEITVPGEVQVYNPGITAGRMQRAPTPDGTLEGTRATDLLVLGFVPDFLPPASGLITAIPQTPLAHINVLARNRGIPNAYIGGVMDDPNVDQLARVRAPALFIATLNPPRATVQAISEQDFAAWRQLSVVRPISLAPIDTDALPYTFDLMTLSLADVDVLRPRIGGKAAGYLALLAPGTLDVPDLPLVLSVRAYAEHIAPDFDRLRATITDQDFRRDARLRVLVLEGEEAFRARFPAATDRELIGETLARDADDPLRTFVEGGGVMGTLLARPIAPAALAAIRQSLVTRFSGFAPTQGLRFRSSSNIEDIEGFNGAGLYSSHTGFLFPAEADDDRDVEDAIKHTWASYWGTEAYEERQLSRVDHLSGHMAVLVHARFDDDHEVTNSVFLYTRYPDGFPLRGELRINVQAGALSVTNPPPGVNALPEVDLVTFADDAPPVIVRESPSTEVPEGSFVLSDAELVDLLDSARAVTDAWLAQDNDGSLFSQRRRTLTLDFEAREMATGWPALREGVSPHRMIIKQARSLEPSLAVVPPEVRALPYPRDVLARASLVERRFCTAPGMAITLGEAFTDPSKLPDLGHTDDAFTAFVTVDFTDAAPTLGFEAGRRFTFVHTGYASVSHPSVAAPEWAIDIEIDPERSEAQLLTDIEFATDGAWRLARGDLEVSGSGGSCTVTVSFSTPEDFLRSLVEADATADGD